MIPAPSTYYDTDDGLVHRVEQAGTSLWMVCSGGLVHWTTLGPAPLTCLWCIAQRRSRG